jgi:hypothetical protein
MSLEFPSLDWHEVVAGNHGETSNRPVVFVEWEDEFFLVLASVEGDSIPLELDSDEWQNYVADLALSPLRRVI